MYLTKNTIAKISSFLFFLALFHSCSGPMQRGEHPVFSYNEKKEKFYADPVVFFDTDSSKARLDLFIEIPYENINFLKNNSTGKFDFKLTQNITVTDSENRNSFSNTYIDSASYTNDEMIKKSKESHFYVYNYFLEPGKYKIEIKIKDNYSKNEYKKIFDTQVKDFKLSDIAFSDLIILSKYKLNENGTKEITPLISKNIFGLKEFSVFFEIYNSNETELKKDYILKLKDNKDYIIKENELSYLLSPAKNQRVEKLIIMNELKKYMPEKPDFDFFLYDNERDTFFKIEIIDKSNNEIVASKNLSFIPGRPDMGFHMNPQMH